jgi:hypothetical protein
MSISTATNRAFERDDMLCDEDVSAMAHFRETSVYVGSAVLTGVATGIDTLHACREHAVPAIAGTFLIPILVKQVFCGVCHMNECRAQDIRNKNWNMFPQACKSLGKTMLCCSAIILITALQVSAIRSFC